MSRYGWLVPVGAAAVLLAAGCAQEEPGGQRGPTFSSTSPGRPRVPTVAPESAPPKTPTDTLPTDVLVGTVTAGGDGPCYGMETNDGVRYALYGDDGTALKRGDTIRVTVEPLNIKIYCGPGQHVAILKLEIVG